MLHIQSNLNFSIQFECLHWHVTAIFNTVRFAEIWTGKCNFLNGFFVQDAISNYGFFQFRNQTLDLFSKKLFSVFFFFSLFSFPSSSMQTRKGATSVKSELWHTQKKNGVLQHTMYTYSAESQIINENEEIPFNVKNKQKFYVFLCVVISVNVCVPEIFYVFRLFWKGKLCVTFQNILMWNIIMAQDNL